MTITGPKLTKGQYLFFASSVKTIAEGMILGSSAAFFLPEALQIEKPIAVSRYLFLLSLGLIGILFGAILHKRGEK